MTRVKTLRSVDKAVTSLKPFVTGSAMKCRQVPALSRTADDARRDVRVLAALKRWSVCANSRRMETYISLSKASRRLGCSKEEVLEMIRHGSIKSINIGLGAAMHRVPESEIRRLNSFADVPARSGVYIIELMGRYKIGSSQNLRSRMVGLQVGAPCRLRVRRLLVGVPLTTEIDLHERFAASRLHGEWFAGSRDLLAFIEGGQ